MHTCVGLQAFPGLSVQGFSSSPNSVLCGQQHCSSQSSSQPQSHSSPSSTTPLPHSAILGSRKHPATAPLAFAVRTWFKTDRNIVLEIPAGGASLELDEVSEGLAKHA